MSGMIDTNVYLSRWPLRRLPQDEPEALAAALQEQGVAQAWCGSFDGLLHKDVAAVNERLAEQCARQELFVPFGTVNPMLPEWEEDLRRCAEDHKMPGIRLHSSYHQYALDHPAFERLLALAAERQLIVQLCVQMEDERMMHPLLRVPPVDLAPLPALLRQHPQARVVLLNALKGAPSDLHKACAECGNAWFDIAMIEGLGGVANVLKELPPERLLFGSHAPLFYPIAAVLKLKESTLAGTRLESISSINASALLTW